MQLISDRSVAPYKQVCYIETYFPDGTISRGSGSVVGINDVLTALHVVFDATHGGWATKVMVTPGAFVDESAGSFSAPFGTYSASNWVGRTTNWDTDGDHLLTIKESSQDLALIGLDINIAAATGGVLTVGNSTSSFQATLLGYPADQHGLMQTTGYAYTDFPTNSAYDVTAALGPGASGGPLLDTSSGSPVVNGVLSAGDSSGSYYASTGGFNAVWYAQSVSGNNNLLLEGYQYRPVGAGVASGSDHDDLLYEYQLSYVNKTASVYGYKGADALVMNSSYNNYQITVDSANGGQVHVTNLVSQTQLSLNDVNALAFNDWVVYLMTEDQAQIARLYTVFGRTPDFQGLKDWVNAYEHGTSFSTIASSFSSSQEFANRYNAVDNQGFASQLYSTILQRSADADGLAHWTQLLNQGMTRGDAMIQFTNSQENINSTSASDGFIKIVSHSAWTDAGVVIQDGVAFGSAFNDRVYESQLDFNSNGTAELFGYKGGDIFYLEGASGNYQRTQVDRDTLSLSNTSSGERMLLNDLNMLSFTDKNVFVLTNTQAEIARLYTVFDRVPDFNGLQDWLNASAHGMTFNAIANTFSQSQEFANRYNAVDNQGFANQLYQTILGREGEAAGLAHWTQQLDGGLSRGDAMINFTNSQENHNLTEGANGFIQLIGQSDWV